jgi:hypothetical protein
MRNRKDSDGQLADGISPQPLQVWPRREVRPIAPPEMTATSFGEIGLGNVALTRETPNV